MTRFMNSRRLRWAVPAVIATGVAAAAITTNNGAGASEQPNLPTMSVARLLTAVQHAHPADLSGTIVETANLGLPNLPEGDLGGAGGGLSVQSLLTGSHTMRVWYAGPNQQRVAVLAPMSERDVIHNGKDVWTYTSTTNAVTHATVGTARAQSSTDVTQATPQRAAQQALRAINPTTRVTIDRTARVAGRPAYQLVLAPRDTRSLVGSVRIAVDSATWTPLRVQVFAAGSATPAFQVGFTNVSFSAPNPSVFHFVPPAGAKVTPQRLSALDGTPAATTMRHEAVAPRSSRSRVLGRGWTTVVELAAGGRVTGSTAGLLDHMSTPVAGGGRLITTSLVSVLITKDDHIFAGAVHGSDLEHVAATGHGL
jgi:outer membrane lipoprotein-sorting protein